MTAHIISREDPGNDAALRPEGRMNRDNSEIDNAGLRRPTLAEVAALAGVSEITVSRVMRGAASVTPKTAERVEEAARRLGYVPNRLAGALAGRPSNQVAVILPSLSNIVFPDVLKGLQDRLETDGFHPILGISNYDSMREEKLIASLLAWRPAGLVIAPTRFTEAGRRLLREAQLPMVEIMDLDITPVDMVVGISHRQAGKAMGYYLTGRGYHRFGYVGHDIAADHRAGARLSGFREALAEAGARLENEITIPAPSSVALGRRATRQLLEAGSGRPQVIYYSNDDMAVGGMFECQALGLNVPGDIAIAGFNGLELGQSLPVPLTTIASHRTRIGRHAAEQILARLAGKTPQPRIDVGFTLLKGASA